MRLTAFLSPGDGGIGIKLVVSIMILDQGKEALQPIVEVGKLPNRWFHSGGMVKTVDEYPSNGTDGQTGG